MLTEALSGEQCHYCQRRFRPGETISLTGKTKSCKPGGNCTQRVLERNGVRGLKSSGLTGLLTEQFQSKHG